MRMYDFNRALTTVICAGIAGGLIWIASAYVRGSSAGRFWASMGIIAAAGLVMALSQLVGGWTKRGLPRLSAAVFLLAFLPVLICVGWVLMGTQPGHGWYEGDIVAWSRNVGLMDVIRDLGAYDAALAFGFGLVLGFSFDTTGPRRRRAETVDERHVVHSRPEPAPAAVAAPAAMPVERSAADEPVAAERSEVTRIAPAGPTEREREGELVGARDDARRVEIREDGRRVVPRPDPERVPNGMD